LFSIDNCTGLKDKNTLLDERREPTLESLQQIRTPNSIQGNIEGIHVPILIMTTLLGHPLLGPPASRRHLVAFDMEKTENPWPKARVHPCPLSLPNAGCFETPRGAPSELQPRGNNQP
jgi:hypothetical protein